VVSVAAWIDRLTWLAPISRRDYHDTFVGFRRKAEDHEHAVARSTGLVQGAGDPRP
jgi:hypothetical protein